MYKIIFYKDKKEGSTLKKEIIELGQQSMTNKNARIAVHQIALYVKLLRNNGNRLPYNFTKHIEGCLWELRPGNNRIFYFFDGNIIVLLHMFRKKTQKTPKLEIEKAKREIANYLLNKEDYKDGNMGTT